MYLSRLNLKGFKSYTEPVEVNFDSKISVIIGSNGVGKSNALDAIVWGLGEDDPASLRCGSPKDLLFAGSGLARPEETAQVELTFEEEGKELSVRRSISKSGAEEFVVVGDTVRDLTDYRLALDDLGIGHGRRNIIRQEELTDFFLRSPQGRKNYLEQFISPRTHLAEVNKFFEQYLEALMPGSRGHIIYRDGAEVDVEVIFPDKGTRRGVLLSGGERASTALAMKLALFRMLPSPMYMLDEVEPSLDWTHNHNMQELFKTLSENCQLIIVTHFQSTIRVANTVHGVRIRPDGSSWLKFHFVMDERLFKIYKCC